MDLPQDPVIMVNTTEENPRMGGTILALKMSAAFYADISVDAACNAKFCKFLHRNLNSFWHFRAPSGQPRWIINPDKTLEAVAYPNEGKAFIPLEVTFSWKRSGDNLALSPTDRLNGDVEKFEHLFKTISGILRTKNLKEQIDMEKNGLLYWSLFDPIHPTMHKLSRWALSAPEKPIYFPGEKIEQVLYNLVSVRIHHLEDHGLCSRHAVISCIEFYFSKQRAAFNQLCYEMEVLRDLDYKVAKSHQTQTCSPILNTITAIEEVDAALATLVGLLERHVGRAPPIDSRWIVVSKLKEFIRGPMGIVAIDDVELEVIKVKLRTNLATLQRIAPILSAHVRIRDGERRDELKRACGTATHWLERTEMPGKICMPAADLDSLDARIAHLNRVRKHYNNTYLNLMENIQFVRSLVGKELVSRGEKILNVRGMWGRFGPRIHGGGEKCLSAKEWATEKWDDEEHKMREDNWERESLESDVTWDERVEPKWLV